MFISLTKVTIGPVIPLPHNLNSPITGGGCIVIRGVCFTSLLLACTCGCPPSSCYPLYWFLCYPLYGFRCCTWGVCRVPSVGVCVSPVLRVTPCMGFSAVRGRVCVPLPLCEPVCGFGCTRGVFHVTIVGVWVSPVYFSLITWSLSPPGVDTYFLTSLRSISYHRNTVSQQLQHSNILFLKLPWWS